MYINNLREIIPLYLGIYCMYYTINLTLLSMDMNLLQCRIYLKYVK